VAQELARRSLMLSSDQSHLADGVFDTAAMLTFLQRAVDRALEDGFDGLWASGDMLWEFGTVKNLSSLLAYELALDEFVENCPAFSGVCLYHKDVLPPAAVETGRSAHREVILREALP